MDSGSIAGIVLASSVLLLGAPFLITTGILTLKSDKYVLWWRKIWSLGMGVETNNILDPRLRKFSAFVQIGSGIFCFFMWLTVIFIILSKR